MLNVVFYDFNMFNIFLILIIIRFVLLVIVYLFFFLDSKDYAVLNCFFCIFIV